VQFLTPGFRPPITEIEIGIGDLSTPIRNPKLVLSDSVEASPIRN
jgi:hypothetical protein